MSQCTEISTSSSFRKRCNAFGPWISHGSVQLGTTGFPQDSHQLTPLVDLEHRSDLMLEAHRIIGGFNTEMALDVLKKSKSILLSNV